MDRKTELARFGWTQQSTHDEPRLSDVIEMYAEIGMQVHVEPYDPEEEEGCIECVRISPEKYKTIYTRPLKP